MTQEIQQDAERRMKKTIESVSSEMVKLRTGRASPALLEHLRVDYYGTPTPISQVATVSVPDARTLSVTPWDKSMMSVIEKAILESDLGLNPATADETMRIPLPPLTEERRKEMVKLVKSEGEHGKVAVRNIRRDAIHQVREKLKHKEISEDVEKGFEQTMQKLTDTYIHQIDEIVSDKEKEVMEV
ncbi:MAG: ribosome recycling factor [Arenicellales bacterium]|jgi:ribosome recycling factor|nr:ribosome recycling factor [Acidiferrobacteraceae bacterium]MDP6123102.1 ribosome recycling factor [Arenicellales bacterium]MBT59365.1 ribosome recycling factor [Acidiferrobacteraceae bacterium]MDP6289027.1 ribosome recycling factor [Arenicellales bacterium]MDP6435577.1 ribosome recycling factor [Arenicellales bacterium]|tara:strand:+ start:214 stop:771 length:558 start_codon:yes stop_codon:yes gene_type:complete